MGEAGASGADSAAAAAEAEAGDAAGKAGAAGPAAVAAARRSKRTRAGGEWAWAMWEMGWVSMGRSMHLSGRWSVSTQGGAARSSKPRRHVQDCWSSCLIVWSVTHAGRGAQGAGGGGGEGAEGEVDLQALLQEQGFWPCAHCTFHNGLDANRCAVCDQPRTGP